ncbi:MAG TPA: branched-chain amino acid ABC transporter ATP-binding protein/permease [Acetobacteraceae bacterium]|jgi:ABC-type branched-subunit amino acid transport system ATPase component/ABC-type branched-subunit amino acid transport system permease subunit|nr:branched-chain amino acid ABC transporter ATP-binding protein/permease [Acetobacteraceae bacterium]
MRQGAANRLRRETIAVAVVSLVYLGCASLVTNSYYQLILSLVPIWALFGVSWNVLSGYGGQLSFGHASFFGIGAYTVALALLYFNLTPWLGIPLGAVVGAVAGVIIGIPTFRLRGHYFALAMLAYPLAILYVLQYLGFQEVSFPMHREHPLYYLEFSDQRYYTLLAVVLLAAGLLVCMLVENSRFGLALMAIRQNELAAEAAGIDSRRWKMRALVTSGAIAATAGGLYACVLLVLTPDSVFGILVSAQPVVVTLFGGVTSIWGPVIGAAILVPLAESLNAELGNIIPGIQGVVYGAAIIAIILAAPDGLYWTIRDRWFRRALPEPAPVVAVAVAAEPVASVDRSGGELLRVEGLSRSFGGLRAVDGVSFSVASGEILGIIGPNGAGKTTLFNLLNGVLSADEGSATLDGQSMLGRKVHQVCRMGVGRTFQVVRSFPRLPLLDNVVVGAYGAGLPDRSAVDAAVRALARVGLHRQAGTQAGQLTNKQLRLMELARALAGGPRLLLLDETLAGLGRDECDEVLDVLQRLRDDGMTIAIIEHTMHAMMRIADRFVVLDHGSVLASGAPRDVVEDRAVIEAYLGKKWLARQNA